MVGLKNFCILYACALSDEESLWDITMNSSILMGKV